MRDSSGFGILAIGASAGGLKAIYSLLDCLGDFSIPPTLIAQHIHQSTDDFTGFFDGLHSKYRIVLADDKSPLVPNTVYFAPPDYHMYVEKPDQISLSVDEKVCFCRPSIDVLFDSVANVFGQRAIGIILSGANHDGAQGLSEMASAGAYTIVQDPETAEMPVMPAAAIAMNQPSFTSSVPSIADNLKKLLKKN